MLGSFVIIHRIVGDIGVMDGIISGNGAVPSNFNRSPCRRVWCCSHVGRVVGGGGSGGVGHRRIVRYKSLIVAVGVVVGGVCVDHLDVSVRAVIEMACSIFSGNSLTLAGYCAPKVFVPCRHIVVVRDGICLVLIVAVVSCQNLVNYCLNGILFGSVNTWRGAGEGVDGAVRGRGCIGGEDCRWGVVRAWGGYFVIVIDNDKTTYFSVIFS